ncbi:MAG TPA: DEAD/DEAH box helicase [Candidatus Aminicenantes bacterium]|nr:DEAD/DEAH box helicase [Candidatus Aminicenantes bacterium]
MALNPIAFTEKVVRSFLKYQLTTYPFADERLYDQMRTLLSLDETRNSPLLRGPYISLSRPFRSGARVTDLVKEGILHPLMRERIPVELARLYGHQEDAIRAISAGRATLVSTGTGSGKTECFLYPIISKCLDLRDGDAPAGISAVIVYPMNALAEDQLLRLRSLLAGTGIPFGMYVGKTPERKGDVAGFQLPAGASRADYEARLAQARREKRGETIYPAEEVCSREMMRTLGKQPRILLTNVKQLELLLTRQRDVELFAGARLDFLVFDEAHFFTGALGGETACLIRRLKAFCGVAENRTVCVATSATILDRENPEAAINFASRFFGVPKQEITAISEAYEKEVWDEARTVPVTPKIDTRELLNSCVKAVEDRTGISVSDVYREMGGAGLPEEGWEAALYSGLSRNEVVFQLADMLARPRSLHELPKEIEDKVGRPVDEAEILSWLTLAAAARANGAPLLRPVVHGFLRGISGAVVTYPETEAVPKLWLSAEDEIEAEAGGSNHAHLPVSACTTCGQHYFVTFLKDFTFTGNAPTGGECSGETSFWEPLDEAQGGKRVILIDRVAGGSDGEDLDESQRVSRVLLCRHCGAVHPSDPARCLHCGAPGQLVSLYAIRQNEKNPGVLTQCLSCGANGRQMGSRYREPARPVRATTVADVHVLAQDMVHNSERPRLLVFCDNRQDAAFQAGWMKDHARRFRLRALMAEGIKTNPVSIGDLSLYLDGRMESDDSLSRALIPEVWQVARKEGAGGRHEQERRRFLRIQVLRETALGPRQPIGLEPWGRMKVEYEGLDATLPWIQENARKLGLPADDLREGLAGLLDGLRRGRALFDPELEVFSRYWQEGDLEIQQGYLPQLGVPKATKLRREGDQEKTYIIQWLSSRGDTTVRQIARKWGVESDDIDTFAKGLFDLLVERGLLVPVRLKGSKGRPLPGVTGAYQVNADKLRLAQSHGVWRCQKCRRRTLRRVPNLACLAWRCQGELEFIREDPDDYNLQLIDEGYTMLRPEEHTAMVPQENRERLENLFKGESDAVNAFVCTPTLELGVDIGQLDAILMRNVPPLPANYWQRAGRAGRRHRMAVDLTYCRPVSHDRAYFAAPLKLLEGRVDPPAFNMRNEQMVAKHVHASVITRLHQYAKDTSRERAERDEIAETLKLCFPDIISSYLFEGENIRAAAFDFTPLRILIERNADDLCEYAEKIFVKGWPEADSEVTDKEALRIHVLGTVARLDEVVGRLRRRLMWALNEIARLNDKRARHGALGPEDDSIFRRCDATVKRLKGMVRRSRREAEGFDDVNTYGVFAAEGFLPGYGLETGSILATAEIPYWSRTGEMDFALPRPPSVALREYVPGNLIYANGHRFVARCFHRDIDEDRAEVPNFEISLEREAVKEICAGAVPGGLGSTCLAAIPICDVDLVHQSHISDEEEFRFQLAVTVLGLEKGQHNGGQAYLWGNQALLHRRGVRLRLVNVGAPRAIERSGEFGYPICMVCGQSVSPLSSERKLQHFMESHEERCRRKVVNIGFYADVVADALMLPECGDQTTAYSVLEAMRFGATRVLDMHLEDLQILVVGHTDRTAVDAYLWDPMPGGSGLLDLICERFDEIKKVAREVVKDCPSACDTSCVDCLQTYRNSFYHKYLDRKVGLQKLEEWGERIRFSHDIPAMQPAVPGRDRGDPVNDAERKLRHLLEVAGFPEGVRGVQLRLDRAIGTTTPDVIYRAPHHGDDEGICIYLDGLSGHIHGNPATAEKDRKIRAWLRNHGYEVIEIAVSDLDDQGAMTRHFKKLAVYLGAGELRDRLKDDASWFERAKEAAGQAKRFVLRFVSPKAEQRYVRCLPLLTLEAAAGAFSEPQEVDPEDWRWIEIETGRRLRKGMFVAKVVGKSMEPLIPDGSYCLFRAPIEGTRQGKVVLAQLRDASDPETGGRYTVKRYQSDKAVSEEGTWRHVKIALKPINPAFKPIEFTAEEETDVRVIAEMVEVLG